MNKNYASRVNAAQGAPHSRGVPLRTSHSAGFLERMQPAAPNASAGGPPPHPYSGLSRAPVAKPPISASAPSPMLPSPLPPKESEGEEEGRNNSLQAPPPDVPYPEDRIYNVEDFMKLCKSQAPVPEEVMRYASALWREMPENIDDMENNSLRDNLFREQNATTASKVMVDRKIHNEVLGILGKVTVSNLEKMKKELTDLPIRQSSKEEINEVIRVFFTKSTKPEDSCYTPLYVQLIAHLIASIGEREEAGSMIRNEVLNQCRDTFMKSGSEAAELEKRVATMTPEEAELERIQFSGKQKTNIQFLGLMFTSRLVRQKVVRAVLDSLLYGLGHRRHIPTDYSLIHFMELLQVCGPHLDAAFNEEALPRYRETLTELSSSHPQKRIQFLLQNFLETMDNNWVPLHGIGARRHDQGSGASNTRTSAGVSNAGRTANAPSTLPASGAAGQESPQPKIPDYEEFSKVMDEFFVSSSVDEIVSLLSTIPPEVTVMYCTKWLGRYVNTYKYNAERTRLGELFETLVKKNVVTVAQAQEALLLHVQKSAEEELFTDIPKYFAHWASLVRHGHSVFPYSLHMKVLNMLVDKHVSTDVIGAMVRDVEADAKPEQLKELKPQDRFRVLQALLRYTPPMFSHQADVEAPTSSVLLEQVAAVDTEVAYFNELCSSYDNENFHASPALIDIQKQNPVLCASAFFTFVRFDVNFLCTKYKELLRKIFTARPADMLLVEVYCQWKCLECSHRFLSAFTRKVLEVVSNRAEVLNKFMTQLRTVYKDDILASLLDEATKERK